MSEEDQTVGVTVLPKFNMPSYESEMTSKDVKSLALRHGILLDLHPVALRKGWTMDKLSDDMIGLYEQYFEFSGIRVPFSTFLLVMIKHFCVHISQLVPLGLNRLTMFELYCRSLGIVPSVNLFRVFYKVSKQGHWFSFEKRVGKGAGGQVFRETFSGLKGWKKRFFFLDRRVVPDAMAWRHHDSDVNDPVPEDGFQARQASSFQDQDRYRITAVLFLQISLFQENMDQSNEVEVEDPKIVAIRERKARGCRRKTFTWGPRGPVPGGWLNLLNEVVQPVILSPDIPQSHTANFPLGPSREVNTEAVFETLQANFDELVESYAECGDLAGKLVHARLDIKHSSDLYNSLSDRFKTFRSEHEGCVGRLEASESRNKELTQANKDQALRIKELEDTLAKKDSALLARTEKEKYDCVRKLLPTVVEHLLRSHEYKQSLSGPFNLAIQAGWRKWLAEERSGEDLLELCMGDGSFDVHPFFSRSNIQEVGNDPSLGYVEMAFRPSSKDNVLLPVCIEGVYKAFSGYAQARPFDLSLWGKLCLSVLCTLAHPFDLCLWGKLCFRDYALWLSFDCSLWGR
ncbi:hypothetical protein Tco_0736645 [Tanacetum coccineum]